MTEFEKVITKTKVAFESGRETTKELIGNNRQYTQLIEEKLKQFNRKGTDSYSASLAFFSQIDLLRWTKELTESAATVYDKALDREYLRTYIGGGNHRLFDGGHDILSAWKRCEEVARETGDNLFEQVSGYTTALWKDVTTVKGLPFITLDKDTYDIWVDKITSSIPGINKEYLYDLVNFDVMEVFSSTFSVVVCVFALKAQDKEKLSKILSSMGVISILSANPIMGILTIITTTYAYFVKKIEINRVEAFRSASSSFFIWTIFSALGLPILIEILLVIVLLKIMNKAIDKKRVFEYIENKFSKINLQERVKSFDFMENKKAIYINSEPL